MAFSFNLADLVVQLTAKGLDGLNAVLGTVREKLDGVSQIADEASEAIEGIGDAQKGLASSIGAGTGLTDLLKRAGGQATFLEHALAGVKEHGKGFEDVAKSARDMVTELEAARIKALAFDHAQKSELDGLLKKDPASPGIGDRIKGLRDSLGSGGASAALEKLIKQMKLVEKDATTPLEKLKKNLADLTKHIHTVGVVAGRAFGIAQVCLLGWVYAGMRGTTVGEALSVRFQLLSRQIASIFLPQIMTVIKWVGKLVTWFQKLSGDQQANIRKWVLTGMAALAVATILPKIIAGIQALIVAMYQLAAAETTAAAATGFGALLPVIGAVVVALTALGAGSAIGGSGMDDLWKAVKPVTEAFQDLVTTIGKELEPIMESLGESFGEALGAVLPMLTEWIGYLKELGKVAIAVLGPMIQVWGKLQATLVRLLATVIRVIYQGLIKNMQTLQRILERFKPLWEGVWKIGGRLIETVGYALGNVLGTLIEIAFAINPVIVGFNAMADAADRLDEKIGKMPKWMKILANLMLLPTTSIIGPFGSDKSAKEKAAKKTGKNRDDIVASGGQFEDVSAAWSRLQSASLKQGVASPEEETAKNTREILEENRETNRRLRGMPPAFAA